MINYEHLSFNDVNITCSHYCRNSVSERHLAISCPTRVGFNAQLEGIESALSSFIAGHLLAPGCVVFGRLFVSDHANQQRDISAFAIRLAEWCGGCALSVIQQPPLSSAKVEAWFYLVDDAGKAQTKTRHGDELILQRNGYRHLWHCSLMNGCRPGNAAAQTTAVLSAYASQLQQHGGTLKDNCIRTWLYVRDVDFHYQGVVDARRELFTEHDLTKETHFIASTGIEGRHGQTAVNLVMDSYALLGISPGQVQFLQAPEFLNPTHEYGVTFERATSVDFGDRRHIYISGTASIDKHGAVVHPQNIDLQLERTMVNIEELLKSAAAKMVDLAQIIVYLRDLADAETVERFLDRHYPKLPRVLVLAPVCRPGWLVEIEGIAICDVCQDDYKNF